jgi:non-specific serine/threonine protein kinase
MTRLFVFRGGFTPEAAAAVAFPLEGQRAVRRAQQCLTTLWDSSLVLGEQRSGDGRYRLLEMLREYAAELLSPEERTEAERRHAQHYLALAEAVPPESREGPEQKEWLDRLEADRDNLRAALDWAEQTGNAALGLRLALALAPYWRIRGYLEEAQDRLSRLLGPAEASVPQEMRARALSSAAWFAQRQGDYNAARSLCEEALGICRSLGERRGIADCLRI